MSDTGAMLLQAIIDDPDADDLRLIYADWLHDHGDPVRAEFIRVQLRLAGLDEADAEYLPLQDREQALLGDNEGRWQAPLLAVLPDTTPPCIEFRRGFPERLVLDGATYVGAAASLQTIAPVTQLSLGQLPGGLAPCSAFAGVRSLTLEGLLPGDCAQLTQSPHANLHELHVDYCPEEALAVLAQWPGLRSVRTLRLGQSVLPRHALVSLAASPHLADLRYLDILGATLEFDEVAELVRWENWPASTRLGLSVLDLTGDTVPLLASWSQLTRIQQLSLLGHFPNDLRSLPDLPYLHTLNLHLQINEDWQPDWPLLRTVRKLTFQENRLGDAGVQKLAASPYLPGVRNLELASNRLGDAGLLALASAAEFRPLRLDLGSNQIGVRGVSALASSSLVERLRELNLSWNPLADTGLHELARTHDAGQLRTLGLAKCNLTTAGVLDLAGAAWVANLHNLALSENPIGDRAGVTLLNGSALRNLRTLDLRSCELGDATAHALAANPAACRLSWLDLGNNRITDGGARALAASPHLGHLTYLNLYQNRLTPAGCAALRARFGRLVRVPTA